nr:MAG TPA: hypothetical protein [Caudoviricetes sp.]
MLVNLLQTLSWLTRRRLNIRLYWRTWSKFNIHDG